MTRVCGAGQIDRESKPLKQPKKLLTGAKEARDFQGALDEWLREPVGREPVIEWKGRRHRKYDIGFTIGRE